MRPSTYGTLIGQRRGPPLDRRSQSGDRGGLGRVTVSRMRMLPETARMKTALASSNRWWRVRPSRRPGHLAARRWCVGLLL